MFFKKKIMVLLVFTLALTLITVGCGTSPTTNQSSGDKNSSAPIVVKYSYVGTTESTKGQGAQKFKELAEKYTNGKAKVEVYPASQLYGDKDELEAVQAGNVQIIAPDSSKLVGLNPAFQLGVLPFLFPNKEAVYKFWESPENKKLMNSLDRFNLKVMAMWPNGFSQLTNNKRPLVKPEDFKGLKFRLQPGKVLEEEFKTLGAGSATIPADSVYMALQQGTVDSQVNSFSNIFTLKFHEVQKYLTVGNIGRIDYAVIVNKPFWDGLAPDVRQGLDKAMDEATKFTFQLADELDQKSFDAIKNSGKLEITVLNSDQLAVFQKAVEPVYAQFESVIGKDLIAAAKKASQK